jgi:hypothetical protein
MELRPFASCRFHFITDRREAGKYQNLYYVKMYIFWHGIGTWLLFYSYLHLVAEGNCEIPPRDVTITPNYNMAFQCIEHLSKKIQCIGENIQMKQSTIPTVRSGLYGGYLQWPESSDYVDDHNLEHMITIQYDAHRMLVCTVFMTL